MSTPFDNSKLNLMARTMKGGEFPPSLKIDIYKNNPSIFVLTGFKKGGNMPTWVRAGLEAKTGGLLCEAILELAEKKPGENAITVTIDCKSGKEREVTSKVVVGKEPSGKMFISVIDVKNTNAPVIQFFFGPDYYHPVVISGLPEEQNAATVSCLAAKGWARRTARYWDNYLIVNGLEDTSNGGSYKGGNKGGNSGESFNKSSSVTDDDIW